MWALIFIVLLSNWVLTPGQYFQRETKTMQTDKWLNGGITNDQSRFKIFAVH